MSKNSKIKTTTPEAAKIVTPQPVEPVQAPEQDLGLGMSDELFFRHGGSEDSQVAMLQTLSPTQRESAVQRMTRTHGNAHVGRIIQRVQADNTAQNKPAVSSAPPAWALAPKTTPKPVQRTVKPPKVQTKLTVNDPNDAYEEEADRVADEVMRMKLPASAPPTDPTDDESNNNNNSATQNNIQRTVEIKLQRAETASDVNVTPDIESRVSSLDGGGQAMPDETRSFFEDRMGADFSDVRIHSDSSAADLSQDLNARAFTVGNNIAFNKGEYSPDSDSGKKLLAHELTHTVQQGAVGRRKPQDVQRTAGEGTCPVCGKKGKAGTSCGGCGQKFTVQRQARSQDEGVCPTCGKAGKSGSTCSGCGETFVQRFGLGDLPGGLGGMVDQATSAITDPLSEAAGGLTDALPDELQEGVGGLIDGATDELLQPLNDAAERVKGMIPEPLQGGVSGLIGQATSAVTQPLTDATDALKNMIPEPLQEGASGLIDQASSALTQPLTDAANTVKGAIPEPLRDGASGLIDQATSLVDDPLSALTDAAKQAIPAPLQDGLDGLVDQGMSALTEPLTAATDGLTIALPEPLRDGASGLLDQATDAVTSFIGGGQDGAAQQPAEQSSAAMGTARQSSTAPPAADAGSAATTDDSATAPLATAQQAAADPNGLTATGPDPTQTLRDGSKTPPLVDSLVNKVADGVNGATDFSGLSIGESLDKLRAGAEATMSGEVTAAANAAVAPDTDALSLTSGAAADAGGTPTIEPLAGLAQQGLTTLRENNPLKKLAESADSALPELPAPVTDTLNALDVQLPKLSELASQAIDAIPTPDITPDVIAAPDSTQPETGAEPAKLARPQPVTPPAIEKPALPTAKQVPEPKQRSIPQPRVGGVEANVEKVLDEMPAATPTGVQAKRIQRTPADIQRGWGPIGDAVGWAGDKVSDGAEWVADKVIPDWVHAALDALRGDASAAEGDISADGTSTEGTIKADAEAKGAEIQADGTTKSAEVDADGQTKGTELQGDQDAKVSELEADQETKASELEADQQEQSTLLEDGQQQQGDELTAAQDEQGSELDAAQEDQAGQLDAAQDEQGAALDDAQADGSTQLDTAQQEQTTLLDAAQQEQATQLATDQEAKSQELQDGATEQDTTLQADATARYDQLDADAEGKTTELDAEAAAKQTEMQGELDSVGSETVAREQEVTDYVDAETQALTDEATAANTQVETDWEQVKADADGIIEELDAEAGAICAANQQSADDFLASLDPFIEDAQAGWESVKSTAQGVWDDFIGRARERFGLLDDALTLFGTVASQVWDKIKEKALELAISAGIKIAKAIEWGMKAWGELSELWNNTEEYLAMRAEQARAWIADKADQAREWVANKADQAREWVAEQAAAANEWMAQRADGARDFISGKADDARAFIADKAADVQAFIAEKAEAARTLISGLATQARDFISEKATAARSFIAEKQAAANEWIGGQADDARAFIGDKQASANQWIMGKADAANSWITGKQTAAVNWIGNQTAAAQSWIDGRASQITSGFTGAAQGLVDGLTSRAQGAVDAIASRGGPIMQFFAGIVNGIIGGVRSVSTSAINLGGSALEWGLSKIEGLASSAVQLVGDAATGAVNFVGDTATTAVSTVATTASGAVNFVGDAATSAVNFVEDKATGAVNWVADKATGAVNWVETKATSAVNFVENKATGAVTWVENKASGAVSTLEGLATGAVNTVEGAANGAVNAVEGLANQGIQFVADKATSVIDWTEDKATGVVDAAEQAGIQTVNFVEEHGPSVIEFAKGAFSIAKTALWDNYLGPRLEALGFLADKAGQLVGWVNDTLVQPGVEWVSGKIDDAKAWVQEQFPGLMACWELFQSFVEGINEKIRQLPVIGDFLRFKDSIDNALGDILEGALMGELLEDPNGWQILGQVLVGFVPYVGQAADIRDLLVVLDKLESGDATYLDLCLALVAFIPGLGDAIKQGKHLDMADEVFGTLDEVVGGLDEAAAAARQGDLLRQIPTPDGHTIKVTPTGELWRCSTCEQLSEAFSDVLNDPNYSHLNEQFEDIQRRLRENPNLDLQDEIDDLAVSLHRENYLLQNPVTPASLQTIANKPGFTVNDQGNVVRVFADGTSIEVTVENGLYVVNNSNLSNPLIEFGTIPQHGGIPRPAAGGILQSHHVTQDKLMQNVFGDYGYTRNGVPTIWMRTHQGGSPHTLITAIQNSRSSIDVDAVSYATLRQWGADDLAAVGAPQGQIDDFLTNLDDYFRNNVLPNIPEDRLDDVVGMDL